MVKRELPAEKDTIFYLYACNMTCLNLYCFLQYPLRQECLILGRSVEWHTPLEEF